MKTSAMELFLKKIVILLLLGLFGCVQETHLKTVTFKVKVDKALNPGAVGIRGSFTSTPWEVTIPLQDEDKDGVFETTLSKKTAQNQVVFKFVLQEDRYELEGRPNRVITFAYRPEVILYTATFNKMDGKQSLVGNE